MTGGERTGDASRPALLEHDPTELYEQAPCGFLVTTPNGLITQTNATFLAWTGRPADDVVGRRFPDLLDAGGRIYHDTHYAPLLALRGQVREMALGVVRADGRVLPVLVNAVLDRDGAGEPRAVRIAVFDASERRAYERELLEEKRRAEDAEARAVALARTLQATLIPPTPPTIPGLDVAAAYRPAGRGDEVGGDFYDVFQAEDAWIVVLGDVAGKGAGAAVVTALVRHTVRALAVRTTEPSSILAALNEVLLAHETDRFCSLVVLALRARGDGWEVTTASAGHALPLVVSGDRISGIGEPGCLAGVLEHASYADTTVALKPGSRVVLSTDGVTEGRRDQEFYGDERFHHVLRTGPPDAAGTVQTVVEDVVTFQAGFPRDDIAVLALRVP